MVMVFLNYTLEMNGYGGREGEVKTRPKLINLVAIKIFFFGTVFLLPDGEESFSLWIKWSLGQNYGVSIQSK